MTTAIELYWTEGLAVEVDEIERVVAPLTDEHHTFDNGEAGAVVFGLKDGGYFTVFPDSEVYWKALIFSFEFGK